MAGRVLGRILRAYPGRPGFDQAVSRAVGAVLKKIALPFSGRGFLAGETPGLVTVNAIPAARNLKLFLNSGLLLRATRSAADGGYRFPWLDENEIFMIVGQDDPMPPVYVAVARDFLVPVVPVQLLYRAGAWARAICRANFQRGVQFRVLDADQAAWNADYVVADAGPGWIEFAVSESLPANPTGRILLQRRY